MQLASFPANEPDRLQTLHSFGILDTPPEPAFERITALATRLFGMPIAIVCLVDRERQWFKSCVGLDKTPTDRKIAFCNHVVFLGELLIVENTQEDPRFFDNPLVTGEADIRFYAGAPLRTQDGHILGTLCLMDRVPRKFSDQQQRDLADLAQTVIELFELQRTTRKLLQTEVSLTAEVAEAQRLRDEALQREALQRQMQQALQASEIRYHRMIANLHGMVYQIVLCSDRSYQLPWVSEGCRDIYGLDPQQLRESPHLAIDAVHPRDRAYFAASLAHSANWLTTWKWEGRILLQSGEQRWVESTARPEKLENGDVLWNGLLIDITERKQAQKNLLDAHEELEKRVQERTADLLQANRLLCQEEAALARSLQVQQAIFDATPDCVVVIDLEGCIVQSNKLFMAVTGFTAEEIKGRKALSLAIESEHEMISNALQSTFKQGKGEAKAYLIAHDGSLLPYHWKAVAIYEKSGNIAGLMAVGRDITEQLKVEGELISAHETALEASRLKSEFLANMSHEIRTPMNGVIGMTSLLLDTEMTEEQSDYVETIRSSGESLLTIINDILDFSKVESGKLELEVTDFELNRVVEEVGELLFDSAQHKRLELICRVDHDIPNLLKGDPGRLRQVLVNLVGNAIKFTAKGEILIHAQLAQPMTDQTACIHFDITDTGIGLAPEATAALFQPFVQADGSTTRRYGGTGLGLAISRRLVKLMGGEIGVTSQLGVGSTFWLEVPLETKPLPLPNFGILARLAPLQGQRMLILDNNRANRSALAYQLAGWGILADEVVNGEQVLNLLYQALAKQPYGYVILDLGSGGLEVARQIRSDRLLAGVRLILLTTSPNRSYRQDVEGLADVTFLSKPLIRSWQLLECFSALRESINGSNISQRISERAELQHGRILVAEDNIINQKVVVRQLEKLGYRVDVVANGLEVLEAMQRVPYALILMDCQMPELDGFETTATIRAQSDTLSRIVIIAMTAHAMQGDRERCLAIGMDDYLSKPVSQQVLANTLKKWLPAEELASPINKSAHIQA